MVAPTSVDGRDVIALADELARLRRRVDGIESSSNATRLRSASVENAPIPIYDGDGRMVSRIGLQPDGSIVGGAPIERQGPPETPAAPTVVAGIGTLKVLSHGSTEPPWPANFSHLNVWLSLDDDLAQAGIVGTITGRQDGAHIIAGIGYKPYRVWLTSVNTSGAESERSAYVVAEPSMVVAQDILDGIIGEVHLADDAVTEAKIAAEAIRSYHFGAKVVDLHALDDDAVGSDQIAADAILARHIGAGSVTAAAIVADAIQAIHIAAEQIQADHMAADSVTARVIAALAVTADKLAANSVTAGAIQAGAVTAEHIRAGEVLVDITITTGDGSGRRIVVDGPANEVRFYPDGSSDLNYGRLFSWTPVAYPHDVVIELRSINSSAVNVLPRLLMTPDAITMGVFDAAVVDTRRGGGITLAEEMAALGVTNSNGAFGVTIDDLGKIAAVGHFDSYAVATSRTGIWTVSAQINNGGASQLTGISVVYGTTMASPMAPILSVGVVGAAVSTQQWSVRDESAGLTGFVARLGLNAPGGSDNVGRAPSVPPGSSIKLRAWVFRVASEPVVTA